MRDQARVFVDHFFPEGSGLEDEFDEFAGTGDFVQGVAAAGDGCCCNTSTLGFRRFSDISLDYDSHPWTEDGSLTGNSVFLFEPSH
jgi:hypothetical protein